jgi:formylglycine-generating enzyme required for sulfatase activity
MIITHHTAKKALLGLILCVATVLYAGCGGGGGASAPAPAATSVSDLAAEGTVTLKGVVYGPSELSGEPIVGARSAARATGRDLPMSGASIIPCELDENGELQEIANLGATTAADGSFVLAGVPARKNIVLLARREITLHGQARLFTVKAVVLFSAEETVRREKSGVALDAASTLVVECMRDIVLESRLRGKGAIRGADISPEILEKLHSQMEAALTMDQTETAPAVDLVDVTTGQDQAVKDEFKQLVNNTSGGGQVEDTVEEAINATEPTPEPAPETGTEPAPAPVAACVASTQVTGGATAQHHGNGHGNGHGYQHGYAIRDMVRYWKANRDKHWRKHCRSGRGTHCVRVHVVGIQGNGGPMEDAQVTFTADNYSQVDTTDAQGNAYFSNVPYASQRDVVAVKAGYKMIRTSRNIKRARSVWNVVVMMGADDVAPACCTDTDCDDADADTADTCLNSGQASAVCENTPAAYECSTDADCGGGYCINGGTETAACVDCTADAQCDDGDAATIDTCSDAGTESATCLATAATCSTSTDCDDMNDYTADTCENPGTASASCTYATLACLADSDCDDSNAYTADSCLNPGTTASACTHTAAACISAADCDDNNAATADSCQNPGTASAACLHQTITCSVQDDCRDGDPYTVDLCYNPGTVNSYCGYVPIACINAADCNDGNALTIDFCQNPNTGSATCVHQPIACITDTDCNDANASTIDTCANGGTVSATCTHTVDDGWITIAAGSFPMGCTAAEPGCVSDAQPQHQVFLNEYRIMKNSVTNAQYQQCVAAGACTPPLSTASYSRTTYYGNAAYADYPVIYVSWGNAESYCNYAGGHLPTEAQWEKAARGADARTYPWGEGTPACILANAFIGSGLCVGDTSRVGSLISGASPYGALDMAGNAQEWTSDWYDGSYYATSPGTEPTGAASGTYKVIRGGSWHHSTVYLRASFRSVKYPNSASNDITFRCVK